VGRNAYRKETTLLEMSGLNTHIVQSENQTDSSTTQCESAKPSITHTAYAIATAAFIIYCVSSPTLNPQNYKALSYSLVSAGDSPHMLTIRHAWSSMYGQRLYFIYSYQMYWHAWGGMYGAGPTTIIQSGTCCRRLFLTSRRPGKRGVQQHCQ
jgi:hypothetical protein